MFTKTADLPEVSASGPVTKGGNWHHVPQPKAGSFTLHRQVKLFFIVAIKHK